MGLDNTYNNTYNGGMIKQAREGKMDEKKQQAIEIIATEIAKLPANYPMDHGTLGRFRNLTQREGQAHDMAKCFVRMAYGLTPKADPDDPDNAKLVALIDEIAGAAIAKTGK